MATKISTFITAESTKRWDVVRKELRAGIEQIAMLARDKQADVEDKAHAAREIEFLRSLLAKV